MYCIQDTSWCLSVLRFPQIYCIRPGFHCHLLEKWHIAFNDCFLSHNCAYIVCTCSVYSNLYSGFFFTLFVGILKLQLWKFFRKFSESSESFSGTFVIHWTFFLYTQASLCAHFKFCMCAFVYSCEYRLSCLRWSRSQRGHIRRTSHFPHQ